MQLLAPRVFLLKSQTLPHILAHADAVLLEQALQNLANNALKYNRPGGLVRVNLTAAAGFGVITVDNTGKGLSAADRPRVFEGFDRGDPSRNRDRASGVGLSLSREILRAHGGDLTLAPAVPAGNWTEFVATVPLAPPPLAPVVA